ncbi:MAG: Type III restriction-modification enzyme,R/helicase subunit [Candidatus Gottesmanbacteria bacterium GW2011_GWA2_47_9]|uniref:Type III restriction-modification enzyme,R/helicase subunit n=1 Tax=Candidatus Gottesmanbacteria bacterium GW2011_GWA2_47_9 TaxID=1618445 RepID=A0A0G1U2Q5_9BACT|nr:MAG: Type III restriction-modification enzyme,R/helicase subunit [Candidatus Gottesmanbacteria bacterium GW2011_GWA2_47_9]
MAKTTFILNTPYVEPIYHFKSDDRGLTPEINEFRRPSSFYIPVPKSKNKSKQMELNTAEGAYGSEIQRDNVFINRLREKLSEWRKQNYPGLTKTSRDLLFYWNDESRTNKLFFCQIEALETLMYATEVAEKSGEGWIINELRQKNTEANPGLYRMAFKMATGSGKTVVMAMMIAYNTLNKIRYPMDTRFTDAFVVVTPGITIRDRLNVLLPNDPHNYYLQRDIVSYQDFDLLQQAVVHIVNFQQLELRQNPRYQMGGVLKASGLINEAAIKETPNAMVNRVFKSLMGKPRVLVLNDEAHHCYREKPMEAKLTGDDREEADKNNKAARVWISGLEALAQKMEVNAIIDLSATPYFLRGSGYPEGELFPWVVSDFSLLDALECGIVKIPRLPVSADNITENDEPEFRNLWLHVRDDLPKKGLKTGDYDLSSVLVLPTKLSEALLSLYKSYESYYKVYEEAKRSNPDVMPPVMIVVCNNTTVSELVYRWVAGYERQLASGKAMMEKGNLDIFRNEDGVNFLDKPNTLIIDSEKLESGEKIDENFKKIFEKEISDYHKEYRIRFPGREDPTDEELLREVMNTVGKSGKLGENIKCVVSVSMLTEGWDVNTVTHILGIRAFSTQLLCEQVVGRALRRIDYTADEETGLMREEYAEVYGVPFNFLRVEGNPTPQPPKVIHRVHSLDDREQYQITFPRVQGYRFELNEETLAAHFTDDSRTVIENEPTQVILGGMIGEETTENMEKIKERRQGEVVTRLSEALLKRYYTSADGQVKYWLFPQIKRIAEEYVTKYVVLKDKILTHTQITNDHFIFKNNIFRRETVKSHINYVVADTEEWEQGVAKKLEEMPEVLAYVKNQNLGFSIPYEYEGISRQYITDFIVKLEMPDKSILNLLIEVTGLKRDQKAVKVKTAKELWIPAVNNAERFGKWAIIEIQDIHQTQQLIRFGMTQGFANEVN